jgi:GH25 family lysozyme M1 (1,4-beta-N-acetylmuramidase)
MLGRAFALSGHILSIGRSLRLLVTGLLLALPAPAMAEAPPRPVWTQSDHALVLDGYEYNQFDLNLIAKDTRVAAFIHKGSDGMPPRYGCPDAASQTEKDLCKKDWKVYSVGRELFHARRGLAKSLGLKWGAYHMARPGNPREQANHFLDFAEPGPDDLMALDIEDNDPVNFMSLTDAEEFVRHIYRRTGRYPVLYTNGSTANHIAENRGTYRLLSRLNLWYARYKPDVAEHFPQGNWESYTLWQFASQVNCNKASCPYRVGGTGWDIDVNVAEMSVDRLRKAWPLGKLQSRKGSATSRDWPNALVASASPYASEILPKAMAALDWAAAMIPRKPQMPLIVPDYGVDMMQTSAVTVSFFDNSVQRRCSRVISRHPMSDL